MAETILSLDKILKQIPVIKTTTNYWMLRADGGKFFTDFFINSYIGIGWNEISVADIKEIDDEEELKERLKQSNTEIETVIVTNENGGVSEEEVSTSPSQRSVASWASQLLRFVNSVKVGDIVIVPNEGSSLFNAFIVTKSAYDESQSTINEQNQNRDYKHSEFKKRIGVSFIKNFSRRESDSAIYPLIYSHHTLTDANEYKTFLNRAIFDVYIENELLHATFQVTETNTIGARSINQFLSGIIATTDELFEDEDVDLKINVQSPGPAEIAMYTSVGIVVITVIVVGIHSIFGGKLSIGKGDNIKVDIDSKGILESLDQHKARKLDNEKKQLQNIAEGIEKAKSLNVPFSALGIEVPEGITKVIDNAIITDKAQKNAIVDNNDVDTDND